MRDIFLLVFKIHERPKKHAKVDFDIACEYVMSIFDGLRRLSHEIALLLLSKSPMAFARHTNSKRRVERKTRAEYLSKCVVVEI